MGSALGARLRDGGARVLVALDGRSDRTRGLASDAELEDVGSLNALMAEASVVLSVVPPGAAVEVAEAIASAAGDSRPLVADLNAVAPTTVRRVADLLTVHGIETVDGSISGPPPTRAGTTRMYLSGARAADIASLPVEGVELILVGDTIGLASAVKMCTASVYKGRVALLAQALRTAAAHGVVEHVLDDLVRNRSRRPGADRRDAREGIGQGVALRRRDGGDCRDAGRRGSHAGTVPRRRAHLRGSRRTR